MKTIRLEGNFNEAVLPENIQFDASFGEIDTEMEKVKLTPKDKCDKARKGLKSHYREDLKG